MNYGSNRRFPRGRRWLMQFATTFGLAFSVILGFFLGFWLGGRTHGTIYGVAGALIGFVGGMGYLLWIARRENRD